MSETTWIELANKMNYVYQIHFAYFIFQENKKIVPYETLEFVLVDSRTASVKKAISAIEAIHCE